MATLSSLAPDVQNKLRDPDPVFWSLTGEVYPALVEAQMEACLISGEPEIGSVQFTISDTQTFQAMPANMVAILRVNGPGLIQKAAMWDLDAAQPGWQGATSQTVQQATFLTQSVTAGSAVTALVGSSANIQVGTTIGVGAGADFEMVTVTATAWGSFTATFANNHAAGEAVYFPPVSSPINWFPFGMSGWGVYPKIVGGASVVLTGIMLPVTGEPPWTGNEQVPFQNEMVESLSDYAAHVLRLKESGAEFRDSLATYQRALNRFGELSRFAIRTNDLRFAKGSSGAAVSITPVEVK